MPPCRPDVRIFMDSAGEEGKIIKPFKNPRAILKKPYIYWSLVLLSMLMKYLYYGFKYFPVVDDNNMYGTYSLMSPLEALLRYKMYTARPFAALLDTYVIARFWGNLEIILVLMILLHFVSALLIYKVFEKNDMKIGILPVLFFVLNPLGTDATYWIAASSRVVAGLFFASLSFYLITLLCGLKQGSRRKAVLIGAGYLLTSLLSYGFYEQVTAFSFVFSVVLIVVNLRKSPRLLMLGITFANIISFALYFYHFRDVGTVSDRGQLVHGDLILHTLRVTGKYLYLLSIEFLSMLKNGIATGFSILLQDRSWFYLAALMLVSVAAAVIYANENLQEDGKRVVKKLLAGLALVVVSYAPFYVLDVIWIANRNTLLSYIGLGLILETLIGLVFRAPGRWSGYAKGFLFGMAVFALMLVNIAEVHDYKNVNAIDKEIVNNLAGQLAGADNKTDRVYVFNTKSLYFDTTGKHLSNCSGVDWAFTGAAHAITRNRVDFGIVIPVKHNTKTAVDMEALKKSLLFGLFEDRRACRLSVAEEPGQGAFALLQENGEKFGDLAAGDDGTVIFTRSDPGK